MRFPVLVYVFYVFLLPELRAACIIVQGDKTIEIPNSTTVSLTEKKKSLKNLTIQDQDGLGTCYANAASVVLKSVLSGNPNISYSHAALTGASRSWSSKISSEKYVTEDGASFTSDDSVCATVLAMKDKGGACGQKHSILENQSLYNKDVQNRSYVGIGKFFDIVNKYKYDPGKQADLKRELKMVVGAMRELKDKYKKQCEAVKLETYPMAKVAGKMLGETLIFGKLTDPCFKAMAAKIAELATPESLIKSDRNDITLQKVIGDDITAEIESNPALVKKIQEYYKKKKNKHKVRTDLGNEISALIHKVFQKYVPNKELAPYCKDIKSDKSPLIPKDYSIESIIYHMKDLKRNDCNKWLEIHKIPEQLSDFRREINDTDTIKSCSPLRHQNDIFDAIAPMLELGIAIDDEMLKTLSDPVFTSAHQMELALMPGCLKKSNLIKMDDISCATTTTCDFDKKVNPESNLNYPGKAGTCLNKSEAQKIFRSKVFEGIKNGRSLAMSFCTDFFLDPNADTDYCQKAKGGLRRGNDHSRHVAAITGYRCVNNEIQYEMVNSWGAHCPVDDEPFKNSAFECQISEDGVLTGKYWVKEKALVNNAETISEIKKGAK